MTSQPRHAEPFPLGTDELPYSKGLTARALIAVGVPTIRAHELARKIEKDLADRGETAATLDRIEELAEDDVSMRRLRRYLALLLDLRVGGIDPQVDRAPDQHAGHGGARHGAQRHGRDEAAQREASPPARKGIRRCAATTAAAGGRDQVERSATQLRRRRLADHVADSGRGFPQPGELGPAGRAVGQVPAGLRGLR